MSFDNSSKNVNDNQETEILPGYDNIETFTKDGYRILMEAIRHSNSLPTGSDWNFYKTHDAFNKIINEDSGNLLSNINTLLHINTLEASIRNRGSEEKTELMIEANDVILERVANNIDEMNGIKKSVNEPVLIQAVSAQLPVNGSWNRISNATFSVSSSLPSKKPKTRGHAITLLTAKNIVRPQKLFKDKIINSCKHPWEPRIKEKPNSLKPLAIFLEETEKGEEFSHPYEFELEHFQPSPEQLQKVDPVIPRAVEDTALIEINTPEQVDELVETLRKCKEFAVDLEHHSYRSFMGITCLIQISTYDADYIIDTFSLRDKLHVLNEVFTAPSILKIFHGADMDIQWLQRDLSIYVVNMFDTYQAAKTLQYSGRSLAYLMQRFCNFQPNKQFQLADWRIRPLPDELKAYAREDTHFLIYIYQRMKNHLLEMANGKDNLLLSVFNSSTELCKRRYFRPVLTPTSYMDFYRKCKRLFDNRQLFALRELYKWRDEISREEDESTGYVLPNHMLLQISETLPREMQGILACCNPIPPLVRANALEIHQIILKAREQPLEKAILKEDTRARGMTKKISKINVDSPFHCPHDLTQMNDFQDDLPTLLAKTEPTLRNLLSKDVNFENSKAIQNIFETPENSEDEAFSLKKPVFKFLGPFERYKLVKPYIEAEEKRMADEKAANDEKTTQEAAIENTNSNERLPDTVNTPTDAALTQPTEQVRTDEDRIESIREHFLKLSRLSDPPKLPQTLVQMGGTKKRKRNSTSDDMHASEIDLCSTVPNINRNLSNPRKRRSSNSWEADEMNTPKRFSNQNQQQSGISKGSVNNRTPRKKKQWNQQNNINQNINNRKNNNQNINNGKNSSNPNINNYNTQNREQNVNMNRNSANKPKQKFKSNNYRNNQGVEDNRGNTKNKFRPNKKKNNPQSNQNQSKNNQEFTPYDYSAVDFRQFEGGAQKASNTREFKANFKSKGKKKFNKSNNRSSQGESFSRGRGRGGGKGRGRPLF